MLSIDSEVILPRSEHLIKALGLRNAHSVVAIPGRANLLLPLADLEATKTNILVNALPKHHHLDDFHVVTIVFHENPGVKSHWVLRNGALF